MTIEKLTRVFELETAFRLGVPGVSYLACNNFRQYLQEMNQVCVCGLLPRKVTNLE